MGARAMHYVANTTSIPVPRVHMALSSNNCRHIVMEKVDGVTLDYAIHNDYLSRDYLTSIVHQLKDIVTQLRGIGKSLGNRTCGSWPSGTCKHYFFLGFRPQIPDEMATVSEFLDY